MPPVKKPAHSRGKHFLKEWRNARDISQEDVADRVGISRSLLSKIESGVIPYNQDLLEKLADAYGCRVLDLVGYAPNDLPPLPIFDLPEGDIARIESFTRALRIAHHGGDGTNSAPTTPPAPAPARTPRRRRQS